MTTMSMEKSGGRKSSRSSTRASFAAQGLTKKQTKELGERLFTLRVELLESIEEKADFVVNMGNGSENVIKGDDAEVAEKQRVSNAALQELDILKGRLGLVQRAFGKIESGVYGYCEETEEPIGYERLSIVPWARYSVQVQERRERQMRDYKVSRSQAEL